MQQPEPTTVIARRPASLVMRLSRLGSFHQSRLSFMRVLTRRLKSEQWTFKRSDFAIDAKGVGYAVYSAIGPERTYSLIAFAHDLPDELRSDRVIAEQWDSTFVLFDGVPTDRDIERLSKNVPHQEAGRVTESELTLSRANRSVRLWQHVVDSLASGKQPEQSQLDAVGYLMRTTAVYGSGKFGAADRHSIANRGECKPPFQVEMLTVYLIRTFVRDLVQHMANVKGGKQTVKLEPELARTLGIGNSTGLGMAPFILNHPSLFNNWIVAREQALADVRSIKVPASTDIDLFRTLFRKVQESVRNWSTDHIEQQTRIQQLNVDLKEVESFLDDNKSWPEYGWNALYLWAEGTLGLEAQECLVSLMLEPYGELIDGYCHCMGSDAESKPAINGSMTIEELSDLAAQQYSWARGINWDDKSSTARAWYVSTEKLEPRLGERHEEPLADYEQPLSPARDTYYLLNDIQSWQGTKSIAEFLLQHPEHRHTVRRIQILQQLPYGEIRDNTIASDLVPIDMLRCKLSFFGAIHFDPRSDRWVRIRMFGNAPYPEELVDRDADFWPYAV